jgi:hypothetical protein
MLDEDPLIDQAVGARTSEEGTLKIAGVPANPLKVLMPPALFLLGLGVAKATVRTVTVPPRSHGLLVTSDTSQAYSHTSRWQDLV